MRKSVEYKQTNNLHLEPVRATTTTGLLELSTLALHVRLDGIMSVRIIYGSHVTKVLDALAGILGATEKNSGRALGGEKCQLI